MARGVERAFPLTPLQEGMLYHTLREPDSGLYHGQVQVTLEGHLEPHNFLEAWRIAARRHEVFRTAFAWERRERPLQVVLGSAPLPVRFLDWSELPQDVRARRWLEIVERDRRKPFDLLSPPMMRWVVARESDASHRLLWGVHHALLDGWSAMSVLGEVLEDHDRLVAGEAVSRPAAPSMAEFVGWLSERDTAAARRHWTETLAGVRRAPPLPDGTSPTPTPGRVTRRSALTDRETTALVSAASRLRVTLNTLVVAAWARLLGRRTGREDVVFGVTVSDRPAAIERVEVAAGLYLATVPVRVRLGDVERGGRWLSDLQRDLAEGRTHAAPGLSEIQRWSGVDDGPLLTSLVVFESFPAPVEAGITGRGLEASDLSMTGPSDLPLALLAYPGERLRFELVRCPSAVPVDEAEELLREVAAELRALASDTASMPPVAQRSETSGSREVGRVVEPVDGPRLERDAVDVVALVEGHAQSNPDATAVASPAGTLTYADLDARADDIARMLTGRGAGRESFVGVLAGRSVEGIVAVLGTLKAGCAYVPLDPAAPPARIERMCSATELVLVTEHYRDRAPGGTTVLEIPDLQDAPSDEPRVPRAEPTASDLAAYAVFTSGSTGEPKGVVVERAQLAWSTAARLQYYPDHPGVFLLLSPFTVDSATAGIYWTLCTGGTLVLPPERAEQDVDGLAALVARHEVTHTLLVPSLHRALLDDVDPSRLESLRVVVVAGEACRDGVARLHRRVLPGVALYNEYGPSEATVWASVDALTITPSTSVTIGRPVPGVRVHLLDPELRDVPAGQSGEIVISGPGVARGYLGRDDLTAERFVEDPRASGGRMYRTGDRGRWLDDGRLRFLGRIDDQVKVRGRRVEVEEVEAVLATHPDVRESLVALVDPNPGPGTTVEELADALLELDDDTVDMLFADAEVTG